MRTTKGGGVSPVVVVLTASIESNPFWSLRSSAKYLLLRILKHLLAKMAIPGLFLIYFRLFKQTLQFLQQINVKNVHQVCGAWIQTHDFQNMSRLP